MNELTDLPDDVAQISKHAGVNARIRTEGNQNLIEAGRRSGSPKILAQSVAWLKALAPAIASTAPFSSQTRTAARQPVLLAGVVDVLWIGAAITP